MAKKKIKVKPKSAPVGGDVYKPAKPMPKRSVAKEFPFGRQNYILFAVGMLVIILGFVALATGDITIAPILLVLGYCVIIPAAILYRKREKKIEPPPAKSSLDSAAPTSGD